MILTTFIQQKLTKLLLSAIIVTILCMLGAVFVLLYFVPQLWTPMLVLCAISLLLSVLSIKRHQIVGMILTLINGVITAFLAQPLLLT